MTPQDKRGSPPYLRIVDSLRERILSGDLAPGDPVPSTRKLMKDHGIAMATATRVLATLKMEGLTSARPGVGTVVADDRHNTARDRIATTRRGDRIYPKGEHARILAAELAVAPEHVAEALGIAPGSPVIRRHRVTISERLGGPVSASTSWFAGGLAAPCPQLLVPERLLEGTPRYIENMTGRVLTSGRDSFTAGAVTADEAADVAVEPGTPVLRGRNWIYDQHGAVVEYGESLALSGRWSSYDYQIASKSDEEKVSK